jgi:hypothetical protein
VSNEDIPPPVILCKLIFVKYPLHREPSHAHSQLKNCLHENHRNQRDSQTLRNG